MATVETGPSAPTAVSWPQQVLTFARLTIYSQLRNRRTLLFGLAFPVVLYLFESRLFIPQSGPGVASGRAVLAVTFGIFGAFSVALTGFARQFSEDITAKRYRKLRSLPLAPSADFTGRFCGSFVVAVISEAVVFVVAVLDGGTFDAAGPLSVPIVLASLLAFCLVAMTVATLIAVVVAGDNVPQTSVFVLMIVFFATGFNGMSVSLLPSWLQKVVNYVPNALAARMQIAFLVGHPGGISLSPPPLPDSAGYMGLLAVYAVISVGVATLLMRRYVYAGEVGE